MNTFSLVPLLALLALTASETSAQEFYPVTDTTYQEVQQFDPPVRFRQYESVPADDELREYLLTVVDSSETVHIISNLYTRGAGIERHGTWEAATTGCGSACFYTWFLDTATGRVSSPIFAPLYVDAERSFVVTYSGGRAQLFDPFDPVEKWGG